VALDLARERVEISGAAALAAATAASMSALLPCATRAKTPFVAGLMVSKYWPAVGATQRPLMK